MSPLEPLHWIVPQPGREVPDCLALHALSQDFQREVEERSSHESHCQWYADLATQHRRDLERMRREVNFFSLWG